MACPQVPIDGTYYDGWIDGRDELVMTDGSVTGERVNEKISFPCEAWQPSQGLDGSSLLTGWGKRVGGLEEIR